MKKVLRIVLLAVLIASLFAFYPFDSAQASSTLTLRPNGAGDETSIGVQYPASNAHWDKVDEASPDDNSTYVQGNSYVTAFQRDLYAIPNHTTETGTISKITVYIRCKSNSLAYGVKASIKSGTTVADSTKKNVAIVNTWKNFTEEWTINPDDSAAWEWADIDALQIGVSLEARSYFDFYSYCTQVYVEVDYTPVPAPTVTTQALTSVEETTATGNGNITVTSENCTRRGFAYKVGTSGDPTTADSVAYDDGSFGTGAYTKAITGLTAGESYRVRAYAVNTGGTGYGATVQEYTKCTDPTALAVTAQTSTTISLSWTKGTGAEKTLIMYKTTGYSANTTDGTQAYFDTASSTTVNTPLSPGQIYYFRAWAWDTNAGYSDGYDSVTDYTLPGNPSALTPVVSSNITIALTWTQGTAGDKTMVRRATGAYPATYADGTQIYFDTGLSKTDTPLDASTTYFYRAWAYDSDSGYYSASYSQATATTYGPPTVTTQAATGIGSIVATFNGNITSLGGDFSCTERGFVYDTVTHGDPGGATPAASGYSDYLSATGVYTTGAFSREATGLSELSVYFVRAYAKNDYGYSYGDEITFTTGGLVLWIEWQYRETTFLDLSGNGNTANVTFRTTASDNISASLISYQPVSEAKLSSFTLAGSLPTLATPSGPEGGMYVEGDYSHIPGAEAVNEMLGVGGVPYSLWWYPFIYFGICIIGFIIYGATQGPVQPGSTSNPFDGSLLTMALVMEALIVVAGIMNPVPLWPAYLFPIPAIAIIISRKHYSWG